MSALDKFIDDNAYNVEDFDSGAAARADLAALRAELEDWRDSAKQAAIERCPPDGIMRHCTCVGPLRAALRKSVGRG